MVERFSRITEVLKKILAPEELIALDARRAVSRRLNLKNGAKPSFRDTDTPEFKGTVEERTEALRKKNLNEHILFRDITEISMTNPLAEEALYWDINSDIPLDPKAAKSIREQYEKIDQIPVEMHRLNFPLFMFGYMLGHSTRVAVYSALTAQGSNKDPVRASVAGFWHDIGKLEKNQKALTKIQGKYNPEQLREIRKHPTIGSSALCSLKNFRDVSQFPIRSDMFEDVYDVTLKHHVRPDGNKELSYPAGISPSKLTPLIQTVTLADAFDSMATRTYNLSSDNRQKQIERAFEELEKHKGSQFDPALVDIFKKTGARPKN